MDEAENEVRLIDAFDSAENAINVAMATMEDALRKIHYAKSLAQGDNTKRNWLVLGASRGVCMKCRVVFNLPELSCPICHTAFSSEAYGTIIGVSAYTTSDNTLRVSKYTLASDNNNGADGE